MQAKIRLSRAWPILIIMAVALGLRVWYLTINPLWPQFSDADDGDYFRRALHLALTGAYVDDSWLIRPPLHVWVFAGWLRLALLLDQAPTLGVRLIQAFQVGLGVLLVPLCYGLAAYLFGRRAGLLFALFWAIWFPFVELPATLFSEPLYLFFFALHLWLLTRYDADERPRWLVLAGLTLGCAALTRSPALYALVFLLPWLLVRQVRRAAAPGAWLAAARRVVGPFGLLVACTLAVVLPWTVRNWVEYRRVILIDTLGPINLWLDLDRADARNEKIARLRQLPQAERQAYALAQVRAILREDPLRPLREVWPTFRHIWKAQYVEDLWVKRSFFTRPLREAAPLGLAGDLIWLVIVLAGVIGLLHPRTDRPFKWLTALWLLYTLTTVLIFHVEPRYLLPIWWLLGLYAAWTLSAGRTWLSVLRTRPRRGALIAAAVVALLLLIVSYRNYPAIVARGMVRDRYLAHGDRAYRQGENAAAEQAYRAALQVDPGMADVEIALALALAAQGRTQEALAVVQPGDSRRSALVVGVLQRMSGATAQARTTLSQIEGLTGEDTQRWAFEHLPVETRSALTLGDDALDLGYIAGFSASERSGSRTFRWLQGTGEIRLPLSAPVAAGQSLMLELAAPLPLAHPLRLSVNGQPVALIPNVPAWRVYHLALPPSLTGATELRLQLRADTRVPARLDPASTDPRALSVMLRRVALR